MAGGASEREKPRVRFPRNGREFWRRQAVRDDDRVSAQQRTPCFFVSGGSVRDRIVVAGTVPVLDDNFPNGCPSEERAVPVTPRRSGDERAE